MTIETVVSCGLKLTQLVIAYGFILSQLHNSCPNGIHKQDEDPLAF